MSHGPLIRGYGGRTPQIAADVFIAPGAVVIGHVVLEAGVSVWYGAVIRGDSGRIVIGARSNVQDNAVIHVNTRHDTVIGMDVTLGHGAIVEGCTIGNGALLGMRATVLDGATVGEGALIAAGTVVLEGQTIPPHTLAVGVPARVKGPLSEAQRARVAHAAAEYVKYAQTHRSNG